MNAASDRVVVALGGNALLQRGQPLTAQLQRRNVEVAAEALAPLARTHDLVITHGNGPQVGLLALQNEGESGVVAAGGYPLDVLDAETEGMIGYLVEQELRNQLPHGREWATLLTQIEVDREDPAFLQPGKPIGPVYSAAEARLLEMERGWTIAPDGEYFRRVVPSPRPRRILELSVIERLVNDGVVVICAGGGGIPVMRNSDGRLEGVEAVIDKDAASSLLARQLKAQVLLMLTDVDAVYEDWGMSEQRAIRQVNVDRIADMPFAEGSMAPKIAAAIEFVRQTGGIAGIGRLQDAQAIMAGQAGTQIVPNGESMCWWE